MGAEPLSRRVVLGVSTPGSGDASPGFAPAAPGTRTSAPGFGGSTGRWKLENTGGGTLCFWGAKYTGKLYGGASWCVAGARELLRGTQGCA